MKPSEPPTSEKPTVVVMTGRTSAPPPKPTEPSRPDGPPELDVDSMFEEGKPRFRLAELLGEGGTSRVYAAFDDDLEREVAIKVVPEAGASTEEMFAREARVTSSLTHPNVPPVYDIGKLADGYYLALPRIRGRSLHALIREAKARGAASALPVPELVEVLLKVCDALAYAHDHGVIHQDIKPENIMIGAYGEVMLVDWGAASFTGDASDDHPPVGTPSYMAPEHALGEKQLPTSDVYSLGATLFHALLLRRPLVFTNDSAFWKRKMNGDLDWPTREELSKHPRALLAVARRAMSTEPSERYQTIPDMARDMRDYLAGGKNWSAPIVSESFADHGFEEHWLADSAGAFEVRAQAVVSQAPLGALLYYSERLSGGLALEFEGTMLDGSTPGDLSVIWTEDDAIHGGKASFPKQGSRTYCFQVGALSNHLVGIFRDFHQPLSSRSMRLEPGKTYRIRAEIDESLLRLYLDGELVAEYEERVPLRSGYLALYAYYPGKAFANVRIQQRGLPDHVSPLAIGDAFFARGDFVEAEREYRRVELGQGSAELVAEASYKRGVCELRRGAPERAFVLWQKLLGAPWVARIALHRAELAFEQGDHDAVLTILANVHSEHPSFRSRVVQRWSDFVSRLVDSDDRPLEAYVAFRSAHFSDEPSSRALTARSLRALGHPEAVVESFSSERLELCDALLALGRFDTIIAEHSDMTGLKDATLVRQGRLDLVSDSPRSRPSVFIARGQYAEAAAVAEHADAVLAAGAYERALAAHDCTPLERVTALVRLGRIDEALATRHPLVLMNEGRGQEALAAAKTLQQRARAFDYLALAAFNERNREGFFSYREQARQIPFSYVWNDFWCERFLLLPLAAELLGESGTLKSSLEEIEARLGNFWCRRAYYVARLLLGRIDEREFLAQPAQGGVKARLWLARAVAADWAGVAPSAIAAYRSFLALPVLESYVDSPYLNPSVERFARERLTALAPADAH